MSEGGISSDCTRYHPVSIKIFNRTFRALEKLGLGDVDHDDERLIRKAREATGLRDFGDESFRFKLKARLKEIGGLNPFGCRRARRQILSFLENRLYAEAHFKRHPQILEREIAAPVVIVAPPRSGTTRLHRLLATDERFLHLKLWETLLPVPWPQSYRARAKGAVDPRITAVERRIRATHRHNPGYAAVHPTSPMDAEEENMLLSHSFGPRLSSQRRTGDESEIAAYEYMVKLLKLISWWRGDDPAKPWVLKEPRHMKYLDLLMRVFPDARLVFIHRDPVKVVASACSLSWNFASNRTDRLNPHMLGKACLQMIDGMVREMLKARDTIAAGQQLDVRYGDMDDDWRRVVRAIYEFIGLDFTADAERGMAAWIERTRTGIHTTHRYRLEDFGLTPDQVDTALMPYRERFAIPYE